MGDPVSQFFAGSQIFLPCMIRQAAGQYYTERLPNVTNVPKNTLGPIRYRGVGRVCFLPPLFCPTKFVKSSDQFFERKARRRRKNFEVPFFKKLTFLGKFNGQCPHDEKSAAQAKNLGTPFLHAGGTRKFFRPIFHFRPTKFSFWSHTPLKKFGDNVWLGLTSSKTL